MDQSPQAQDAARRMGIAARLLFGALAFRASMETSLSEPASGRSAGAISAEAVLKAAYARPLENGVFLEAPSAVAGASFGRKPRRGARECENQQKNWRVIWYPFRKEAEPS